MVESMDVLKQILEKTEERLNDILEFYRGKKELKKEDKHFTQHSTIIVMTLLEIELIKNNINIEPNQELQIHQYNFKFKKPYFFKIDSNKCDKKIISEFNVKIDKIREELLDIINIGDLCENFGISVIDDIFCKNEERDYIQEIIEKAYNSNFHKFFINYIHELFRIKESDNDIYIKENLHKFKMVKYITQILIFFKLYIEYKIRKKEELTVPEFVECHKNVLKEDKILTYFSLNLLGNSQSKVKSNLSEHNKKALNELTSFYHLIFKITEQNSAKIKNNI